MYELWLPWAYHYGVGGLFCLIVWLALACVGAWPSRESGQRRIAVAAIGGLVLFAALHALWIAWAAASSTGAA